MSRHSGTLPTSALAKLSEIRLYSQADPYPPAGGALRAPNIASIASEMVRSPEMMMRRLREGIEFFSFLRERRELAH
jgi:hypothetical protein